MTRIHVVSLPHTLLTRDYDYCAYTAKIRRFITMLDMTGIEALVYGPDIHDELPAVRYDPIVFEADRIAWFGAPEWDTSRVFDRWDASDVCWAEMNTRAIDEIDDNWQDGDIVGIIAGTCQQMIADYFARTRGAIITEWGIGYSGVLSNSHKVFESYAWMHYLAASRPTDDIHFYDAVIPNCFDPCDYNFGAEPGEYLLFLGRSTPRKGLPIIADIAKRSKYPVVIAGQPGTPVEGTAYAGIVLGQKKAELLAGARAVLCPTTYLEPFGGVAVEAMMSGTPVIATDYGAFTETIVQDVTGYRCHTLKDFMDATEAAGGLDRHLIQQHALQHYSLSAGASLYGDYLRRLDSLHGDGWYAGT